MTTTDAAAQITDLLRPDLRGRSAYGAPQLDVPVQLNTNENSYPVPQLVVAAMIEAITKTAPDLNRYPDREFTALRTDLAGYLTRSSGLPIEPAQIWAGNGSNEVLLHVVQAFAGPGRSLMAFTPSYSMYPNYALSTGTTWIDGFRGVGETDTRRYDLAHQAGLPIHLPAGFAIVDMQTNGDWRGKRILQVDAFQDRQALTEADLWAYAYARTSPCLLYTSPSPRDGLLSRMPSSA